MKPDRLLLTILILSLIVAVFTLYQRFQIEQPYSRVEVVADYGKYKELADDMGVPLEEVLTGLKDAGVTSVAIKEETLETLRADGFVSVMNLWELAEQDLLGQPINEVAKSIKASDLEPSGTVVIFVTDNAIYEAIKEPIKARGKGFRDWSRDGIYAMTISGRLDDLKELPIVFDYKKFESARELGFNIAARPANYSDITSTYIEDLFDGFSEYPVTSVIFEGMQCLGYPDKLGTTARMIKKTGIALGPIETWTQLKHIDQLGLDDLIQLSGFKAARVFSLDKAEAEKITPRGIMDRWFRAAEERNARLIYINPKIEKNKGPRDNFENNRKYIKRFTELISQRGFETGPVMPMGEFGIGSLRLLMLTTGVAAGLAILVADLAELGKRYTHIFFSLAVVGCIALQLVVPALGDKVFALGASIVFPSLSMLYVLRYCENLSGDTVKSGWRGLIGGSISLLLRASLISLMGAAYIASILSPTRYLLEMDIFRGVKIAHIMPLIIFMVAYFLIIGYRRWEHQDLGGELRALLDTPLRVKYAIILGLAAVAGYLYLGRTGHTAGAPVLDIEAQLRTLLEQWLPARPRTKEFLVAHPAFILMVAAAMIKHDYFILPLGLIATIGQVSIVNSFSHLRTPLYVSFYRTVYGLGFGIILGVIGVLLLGSVIKVYMARGRT